MYLGIDPGGSGGIAIVGGDDPVAHKMPETERDVFDLIATFSRASFAYIERVHAMGAPKGGRPGRGAKGNFQIGFSYGLLRGCLISCGIPFGEVTPQVWQKTLGCLTGGDKNVSKRRAQQLFPSLKITHAVADALLIAEYCRRERH